MISPYDRTKAWRLANKEKHAEQQRRYYLSHKEEIAAYQRAYLKRKRNEDRAIALGDEPETSKE